MPKRIQRKRTRGWKMPENAVYVGRPTIYGNPWQAKDIGLDAAIERYQAYVVNLARVQLEGGHDILARLRGKDLACWCPLGQKCHADFLLKLVNAKEPAHA